MARQAASKAAADAQKALMAILPVGDLFKALVLQKNSNIFKKLVHSFVVFRAGILISAATSPRCMPFIMSGSQISIGSCFPGLSEFPNCFCRSVVFKRISLFRKACKFSPCHSAMTIIIYFRQVGPGQG